MSKVIGIDLGTTNSCVAVLEGGEPQVITNAEGMRTTPSVVAFTKDGDRIVGEPAKRQAVTNADRTIISIKTHMGTDYKVDIDGKAYTPQEISAITLQKLKADAEAYLGQPVKEAVITVPAYFTDAQRQATKDAGRIAGLDVKRIINEPTAAALAYGLDKLDQEKKVLVFDLGGGTFDVSILEIGDGTFEVLATAGNNRLGGDDFDQVLIDYLAEEFKKTEGVDLRNDKMALQRLKEAAEKAKKELSSTMTTNVNLPFITATAEGPKHLTIDITRAKFDELTAHLVEKTMEPTRRALQDAGDIHVLQGERSMSYDNTTLGRFQLTDIPPAPRGIPQIEVTFDIDANGIVHVTAKDLGTGKEQKVTITSGTNLSEEEIERKVKEAEMNAEADKQKKDRIEALNQADSTIYQTEKTLNELGDKVSADDKSQIESAIAELKAVKEKESATAEEIKKAMDEVMNKFHKISEQMYQQAQAEQQANAGQEQAGPQDDNIVDADFTEVNDEK